MGDSMTSIGYTDQVFGFMGFLMLRPSRNSFRYPLFGSAFRIELSPLVIVSLAHNLLIRLQRSELGSTDAKLSLLMN